MDIGQNRMWSFICLVAASFVCMSGTASATDPIGKSIVATTEPTYRMGDCRIRIAELFGGDFAIPDPISSPRHGNYYLPATGPMAAPLLHGLGFDCFDAPSSTSSEDLLSIRQRDGRWLRKDRDGNWVPFDNDEHACVVHFTGTNWQGIGLLVDQTTGDENQRTRSFDFCLVHDAHALCGHTPVAKLSMPKEDELPKVEAILRSIEFIDNPHLPLGSHSSDGKGGL